MRYPGVIDRACGQDWSDTGEVIPANSHALGVSLTPAG